MSSVEEKIGKSFLIRAIEWGLNHPDGFNASQIIEDGILAFNDREKDIIRTYLDTSLKNHYNLKIRGSGAVSADSLFLVLYAPNTNDYQNEGNKYVISLDSQFSFIDYQELKFATENAHDAKILSWVAIIISLLAIVISAFNTQDVKIETRQFTELTKAIESTRVSSEQIRNILETLVQVKK